VRVLRAHFVGLPLQVSAFSAPTDVRDALEIPGEGRPWFVLNDDGYLMIDDARMTESAVRLSESGSEDLTRVAQRVRALTDDLSTAIRCPRPSRGAARESVVAVGRALRRFLPLAIVGKPITTALYRSLLATGFDGPPPAPSPSPGSQLTIDLTALAHACSAEGMEPAAVSRRWPEVPAPIHRLVATFARDHACFGPVPWETIGYEDPHYVAARLAGVVRAVRSPPDVGRRPTWEPESARAHALHLALSSWLEATEWGLALFRAAFHGCIRVMIDDCAEATGRAPIDVVFMTFDELASRVPSPSELADRRSAYRSSQHYLDAHAIDITSLDRLVAPL
jgi:hypothetical protein